MPTYTYRCKICQVTHSHQHGAQENPCPPCPMCGGFSERIVGSVPKFLKAKPPAAPAQPAANAHECGSACVLHQPSRMPTRGSH